MTRFNVLMIRNSRRVRDVGAPFRGAMRRAVLCECGLICVMLLSAAANGEIVDGLRAYWDFEDDLTDKASAVGSGESQVADTGMFVGAAGSADFGTGFFGQGLVYNGEDGYVEVPTSADLEFPGEGLSVSAWFRVAAFDTNWQALVAKGEGDNWRMHRNGDTQGMAFTGGTGGDVTGGPDVSDGQWHHAVGTTALDGTSQLWIDGVMVGEGAGRTVSDTGNSILIGNNPGALGREWEGDIDDIAIWNRALMPTEIGMIYNGGIGNSIADLGGAPIIPGDFNRDGVVTRDDFNILRDNMSAQFAGPVTFELGDINFDGEVNLLDFNQFKGLFPGALGQAQAIPEPSSLALVACALAGLWLGCVRKERRALA